MRRFFFLFLIFLFGVGLLNSCSDLAKPEEPVDDGSFKIAISENIGDESLLSSFDDITVVVDNDTDIIKRINSGERFDAFFLENSLWTYRLKGTTIKESTSMAISPVVYAIKKDKVDSRFLNGKEYTNSDVINFLVSNPDIKYAVASPARTNSGATFYFSVLTAAANNPDILQMDDFNRAKNSDLLARFFANTDRNIGSEEYLFSLLEKGDYNAIVANEADVIKYNKTHQDDPLYMLYPADGVGINDLSLSFIGNADKQDKYYEIRDYFLNLFKNSGNYRTWYGGTSSQEDAAFNSEWGTDVSKVMKVTTFPGKSVITEALNYYVNTFRKPAYTFFVLDFSGSMSGQPVNDLKAAMKYIFGDEAAEENLQFSERDTVTVFYFSNGYVNELYLEDRKCDNYYETLLCNLDLKQAANQLEKVKATGGTPLYEALGEAYHLAIQAHEDMPENAVSVVVMTDGEPTGISQNKFITNYKNDLDQVPIYTIAFGDANDKDLKNLASVSNGKFFDGRTGLVDAFREIRGYN